MRWPLLLESSGYRAESLHQAVDFRGMFLSSDEYFVSGS
jgi:hypothetical protein